ncbi:MAG: hypothetical protein PVH19_03925 [Planctomycetia bacterium]|jgi:hypothetical protein
MTSKNCFPISSHTLPFALKSRPSFTLQTSHFKLLEIFLIFVVFFLQGAWPVPDVNEAHYLSKALHFWNPSWCAGDLFLESSATHWAFYVSFGWLTLWFPLPVVAWIGRIITWLLLAWSWRRLSVTILPVRWWSIGTAILFGFLVEHCHMAGEWVIGGVEAKGFAFVLVFIGMERMIRQRWNSAWIAFGAAAMFHVLVGGWAVVAAFTAWFFCRREAKDSPLARPVTPLKKMLPGLVLGGFLSLPGLLPALLMGRGASSEAVDFAHQLYVFVRLGHHLHPNLIQPEYVLRFTLLLIAWLLIRHFSPSTARLRLLHGFVAGSVLIAIVGVVIGIIAQNYPSLAASLLRFYWFRLSDIMIPVGVAIGGPTLFMSLRHTRPWLVRMMILTVVLIGTWHLGWYASIRPFPMWGRFYSLRGDYYCWMEACKWIARSEEIPPDAVFLTPRQNQTFRWYAHRPEVVNWKDIPQDPESLKEWWDRMIDIHATGSSDPAYRWYPTLADQSPIRLQELGRRYGASYVITVSWPPLDLPLVYCNGDFSIYRLEEVKEKKNVPDN